jgi:hypothetical protein
MRGDRTVMRLVVTAVAAFAVLVFGYHHFAAASSQSISGTNTLPGIGSTITSTGTAYTPKGLSAAQAARLKADGAQWQAGFDAFMQAAVQCPVQGLAVIGAHPDRARCITTGYQKWSVPFARFQHDARTAMRTLRGSCRSSLAEAAGLKGAGTTLGTTMAAIKKDVARSQGPGVPDGLLSDTNGAVAAQAAMTEASLRLPTACE